MKNRIVQALIVTTFLVLIVFNAKSIEENKNKKLDNTTSESLSCRELYLSAGFGDLLDEVDRRIYSH